MCAVSAMYDYYRNRVPLDQWTPESFAKFQDIIKRLEKLDEALDQKDCLDPLKATWTAEVQARLDAMRAAAAPPGNPQ